MIPKQGDVHVVYNKPGMIWRVEVSGNNRASGSHGIKPLAVAQARKLATQNEVQARDPQPGWEDRRAAHLRT